MKDDHGEAVLTPCPVCGVAEYNSETKECGYCKKNPKSSKPAKAEKHGPGMMTTNDGDEDESTGEAISDLNTEDARALIDKTTTVKELEALAKAERKNPKFSGGRSGVLDAIEQAIAARKAG